MKYSQQILWAHLVLGLLLSTLIPGWGFQSNSYHYSVGRTTAPFQKHTAKSLEFDVTRRDSIQRQELLAMPKDSETTEATSKFVEVIGLTTISILYWYWMVLAAAAVTNDWPGSNLLIPEAIPLTPGWPPSDQDLEPVLQDSFHFFYLSELLKNPDAPMVNPIRLSIFNIDEAWIFSYLILLWRDPQRVARPVLLILWLALGINLTNAFLAPYLLYTAVTEGGATTATGSLQKNRVFASLFGVVTTSVVSFAIYQLFQANPQDWIDFIHLAQTDRTYLAFCVDLPLFAIFQPYMLRRVKEDLEPLDYVPLLGLVNWMFSSEKS